MKIRYFLPKVQLKAVNSTSVFSLQCSRLTIATTQAHEHTNSIWFKLRVHLIKNVKCNPAAELNNRSH